MSTINMIQSYQHCSLKSPPICTVLFVKYLQTADLTYTVCTGKHDSSL